MLLATLNTAQANPNPYFIALIIFSAFISSSNGPTLSNLNTMYAVFNTKLSTVMKKYAEKEHTFNRNII